MTARYAGRVAIITGSTRGIGRAVALRLAVEGASVVLNGVVSARALEEAAEACQATGAAVATVRGDLADPGIVAQLIETACEKFGGVDVLINNAMAEELGSVADISLEAWERTLRVSLTAAMLAVKHALPSMLARGGGSVVNVASLHAVASGHALVAYEAAKAGMLGLTRSVAVDYGPRGIRCNVVCPGLILSERVQPWWNESEKRRMAMRAVIPTGRPGTTIEVANVVAFLASDEASFVNGACVVVDGGAAAALGEVAALDLMESRL